MKPSLNGLRLVTHVGVPLRLSALLVLATAFVMTGCRTAPPVEPVNLAEPGWTIRRGQALWEPKAGAPELAGQILMASNAAGEEFIRFSKDPMEIVLARRNRQGWSVDMPAFNKSYSGRGQPPQRIGWFQLADAVFGDGRVRGWDWSGVVDGRWRLTNTRSGERLEGFFRE